jgi:hypothetical protein
MYQSSTKMLRDVDGERIGHPAQVAASRSCRRYRRTQNGTPRSHVTICPDSRLTRLHGPIGVKRSGCVKGVKDGQDGQALLAQVRGGSYPAGSLP